MIFFGFGFAWFGETAGALVGPAAPLLVLGPAALESIAFALVAVVVAAAARRCDPRLVPLVAAAAYTLAEQLRSQGILGLPFSQLGVAMIDSPLRPLAAFAGGYGLTFATVLLGASLGWWLLARDDAVRARTALTCWIAVLAAVALAWIAWPARHHAAADGRLVAAVQGGITQSVKRSDAGLTLAIARYSALTRALPSGVSLVLWPETVITEDYTADPLLDARFAALAQRIHGTLYVGTLLATPRAENALRIYGPATRAVYAKEQLVPFAEYLPGPGWLRRLPLTDQISAFNPGINARETIDGATPLICWESLFSDIAHARLRDDPALFLIATDDAWFGTSAGPYEHAQAATLRAVETGRWVLRAAATGISGIVTPEGTWTQRTAISAVPATVVGRVGAAVPGPYARLGPAPFGVAAAIVMLLPFFARRRR